MYSYSFDPISSQKIFRALLLLVSMATTYIAGTIIYIIKTPERLNPGFFDLWLNSHQLFHVFVIGAALQYFHCVSLLAEVRLNYISPQKITNIWFLILLLKFQIKQWFLIQLSFSVKKTHLCKIININRIWRHWRLKRILFEPPIEG